MPDEADNSITGETLQKNNPSKVTVLPNTTFWPFHAVLPAVSLKLY